VELASQDILSRLDRFGISAIPHTQSSLKDHLQATHDLLRAWDCPRNLCLAGLCHSIYGTEGFSIAPTTLEDREALRDLIGKGAESTAYLFGAHVRNSLWENLERERDFSVEDRFLGRRVAISERELSDLYTLTLANWLEQRPRSKPKFHFVLQEEFLRSRPWLPEKGFAAFLAAYGLSREQ
jgi:hypothetical protein